jgi:fucose permease
VIDIATIGAKALYFLFAWLISAAVAAWVSERKGYGERVGLTLGLLLSVAGLVIVLVLPRRHGSKGLRGLRGLRGLPGLRGRRS